MFEFREAMFNPVLGTGQVKGMGAEGLMSGQHVLDLVDRPASLRRRKLKAVISQHGVDGERYTGNDAPKEVCRDARGRAFM